jgi:hypothetical protein
VSTGSAEEHSALSRALSNLAEVEEKVDKVIQHQVRKQQTKITLWLYKDCSMMSVIFHDKSEMKHNKISTGSITLTQRVTSCF